MFRLALPLLIALVALPAEAEPVLPVPFTASYAVSYRGLDAGILHFQLRREEPGLFIYESRAEPSLLARFLVGGEAIERSIMQIDANGVRPLFWFVDDGKAGKKQDGSLVFAWEEGEVRGTMKGRPVELRTEPGLQDRLSIQIAVMTCLLRADKPGTIPMVSDDEIKHYSYTQTDSGLIETKSGEFETVLYESTRPGSSRVSRIWTAPALGYIPVRAEQMRDGRIETVMELLRVERREHR